MKTKIKTFKTTYSNELEGYALDLVIEVWEVAPRFLGVIMTNEKSYQVIMTNEGGGPLPKSCQYTATMDYKREAVEHAITMIAGCSNLYD